MKGLSEYLDQYRSTITTFRNSGPAAQVLWQAGPRGSRIHLISQSQDDTLTGATKLFKGDVLTDNARANPFQVNANDRFDGKTPLLALTNTTNSTITRTNGSFLSDGWRQYDFLMTDCCDDNLANQVMAYITSAPAAGTLTFTGTVFNAAAAAGTLSSRCRLIRCGLLWAVTQVSGAGNTNAVPAQDLLSPTNYPSLNAAPDKFIILGPNQCLIAGGAFTLPATSKNLTIICEGGDY